VTLLAINQFKARLDKFWLHQDILYDYTADLTGIGDRSVHVTKDGLSLELEHPQYFVDGRGSLQAKKGR